MNAWMALALEEAVQAMEEGEVPVGAVVVLQERLIARSHNRTIALNDPTAHAEILVLREAARKLGNYRLNGVELYVTKEPCPMCVGAMIHARIGKLIYGAVDEKGGAFSKFSMDLSRANHRFEVIKGVMEKESAELLKRFFKEKRRK